MSKSKILLLRIQSPDGTKRIELTQKTTTLQLYDIVREAFAIPNYLFALYKERGRKQELISSKSKTVATAGLSHGDLIYLAPVNGSITSEPGTSNGSASAPPTPPYSGLSSAGGITTAISPNVSNTVEEDVDQLLWQQSGKIDRKRDEKFCRHGANGRCVHCSPIEPYDENYLKEHNIKHLSFHSYLRKLTAGVDRGKFVALEPTSCKIKPGCTDHPPWPKGVCSKCTPHAITLNRQIYRHTDNVVVENPQIVERFLDYWRSSGLQRLGFLYGNYEVHTDVPLGIRANVSVIYEPPQESGPDFIRLLPDEREPMVEELAKSLGLTRVGWIFTDLVADESQPGSVKHFRNIDSHFLSAQECIMAATFQNKHPNPCKFSSTGCYGSKFVTVCVTGDATKQVHMEGYQVSEQCMSLARESCFLPTKDAPELAYVPESTDKKYVPDVFYKEKDRYGNEVPRLARPLPVEYLLVDVPASTPLIPQYTFTCSPDIRPFPVENRMLDGHIQHLSALATYLAQFTPTQFLTAASDFHFLLYVATMELFPMQDCIGQLIHAVRTKNSEAAIEWEQSEQWATVEQVMAASGGGGSHGNPSQQQQPQEPSWTCSQCTYLNAGNSFSCEMCNLPR